MWFPSDIYGEYNGPIGPVSMSLGLGFHGLVEAALANNYDILYNLPPTELLGTIGFNAIKDKFYLKGKFSAGLQRMGLLNGSLSFVGIELIKDVQGLMNYTIPRRVEGEPLFKLGFDLSGKLDVFGVLTGTCDVNLAIDLSKPQGATRFTDAEKVALLRNIRQNPNSLMTDPRMGDFFYDHFDVSFGGNIRLEVPWDIPVIGGKKFASAWLQGNIEGYGHSTEMAEGGRQKLFRSRDTV